MPVAQVTRPNMLARFTLRMLGENITFSRASWLELAAELRPDSELRGRIVHLLDGPPDADPARSESQEAQR